MCVCEGGNNKWNNQPTNKTHVQKKQEGETKTEECRMCTAGKSFHLHFLMAAAIRRTRSGLGRAETWNASLARDSADDVYLGMRLHRIVE